jgi:hypothetical protein
MTNHDRYLVEALERMARIIEKITSTLPGHSPQVTLGELSAMRDSIRKLRGD